MSYWFIAFVIWATGAVITTTVLVAGFSSDRDLRPRLPSDYALFVAFVAFWPVCWLLALLDVATGDEDE